MQHRLAVESNDGDVGRCDALPGEEFFDRGRVMLCQLALGDTEAAGPGAAVGQPARVLDRLGEAAPEVRGVGERGGWATHHPLLPVGLDQGHVDAVHGGAAHQAEGAQQLGHGFLSLGQ